VNTPYLTKQGDVLDAICYQFYGNETQLVAVLNNNPHLADQPVLLPMGITIVFPDAIEKSVVVEAIRLWD